MCREKGGVAACGYRSKGVCGPFGPYHKDTKGQKARKEKKRAPHQKSGRQAPWAMRTEGTRLEECGCIIKNCNSRSGRKKKAPKLRQEKAVSKKRNYEHGGMQKCSHKACKGVLEKEKKTDSSSGHSGSLIPRPVSEGKVTHAGTVN